LIRFYLYHDWTLNYRNLFPLRLIKEKEKRIGEHLMVTKEQDTWHCETKECIACYLLPNSIKLKYFFHLFPSIYFYYCNIYYNLKLSCVWVCHSSLQVTTFFCVFSFFFFRQRLQRWVTLERVLRNGSSHLKLLWACY
jgi:hypothetical protein